jgi:hypothetical protein
VEEIRTGDMCGVVLINMFSRGRSLEERVRDEDEPTLWGDLTYK